MEKMHMKNNKNFYISLLLIGVFLYCDVARTQEPIEYDVDQKGDLIIYDQHVALLDKKLRDKHSQERIELEQRFRQEEKDLLNRLNQEEENLKDRLRKEKEAIFERHRREQESLESRQKEDIQREIEERKTYKTYKHNSKTAFSKNKKSSKMTLKERIEERISEISKANKMDRYVDSITSEDDPIIIDQAKIVKAKTEFLKDKDVDVMYQVTLVNQTPKIINLASIIWERTEPFSDKGSTIAKETKLHKPLVPYEKRIVKYNEVDPLRNGEYYTVRVANVVFEDGTQWKNPVTSKKF